jgi:hypothetical protein
MPYWRTGRSPLMEALLLVQRNVRRRYTPIAGEASQEH